MKNRIKSTLSIKSHVFTKIARPASVQGKGSWWALTPEVLAEWRMGKKATVVRTLPGQPHSRSASRSSVTAHAAGSGGRSLRGVKSLPNIRSSSSVTSGSSPTSGPQVALGPAVSPAGLGLQTQQTQTRTQPYHAQTAPLPWQGVPALGVPPLKQHVAGAHAKAAASPPAQAQAPSSTATFLSFSQSSPLAPVPGSLTSAGGGASLPPPLPTLGASCASMHLSPWTDSSTLSTPAPLPLELELESPHSTQLPSTCQPLGLDLLPRDMDMGFGHFCFPRATMTDAPDTDLKPSGLGACQGTTYGTGLATGPAPASAPGAAHGLASPFGLSLELDRDMPGLLTDSSSVPSPPSSGYTTGSQSGSREL